MTPSQKRSLQASISAHLMHARHDSRQVTERARAAFLDSFEAKVDPDGVLPIRERRRRAHHLRQAHMKTLALKSAEVRSQRAAERSGPR